MDVIAENISNAETTRGPDGHAYRRKQVVFETVMQANGAAGVRATRVLASDAPLPRVYKPGHPDADAQGYVEMPNVNTMEEMADLISASRAYEANIGAAQATKAMISRAMELGK
jgi:flagellar basal-body rod protein FlgC